VFNWCKWQQQQRFITYKLVESPHRSIFSGLPQWPYSIFIICIFRLHWNLALYHSLLSLISKLNVTKVEPLIWFSKHRCMYLAHLAQWRKHIYPYLGFQFHSCFSIWDRDNKRMKIINWQTNMKRQISECCTDVSFCHCHSLYASGTVNIIVYVIQKIISLKLKFNRFYYTLCSWKVVDV
jgi:hypothetical protein